MTPYCPWQHVGSEFPDVIVGVKDIHPARAVWLPDSSVILIDKRLTRVEGRCALGHEIAHIELGHKHSGFPWFDQRQEVEADLLASRRLITIHALTDAYRWSHDTAELAEALNVDLPTVLTRWAHLTPVEHAHITARMARVETVA